MSEERIDLVSFAPDHLDGALSLSREAGWPHRREDWSALLALGGGTIALMGSRVIGTALTTCFGARATISMVIVDAAVRGRGLGQALMRAALAAAEGRPCRLIATQSGLPLYEKLGFQATGGILQHQGEAWPTPPSENGEVAWCDDVPIDRLAAIDAGACGMDRRALLADLSAQARFAVLRRDRDIAGFAVHRAFGRGALIGPVVAETAADARALIAFVIAHHAGAFLRVDVPEEAGLSSWLAEQGLAGVGDGVTMRRGEDPIGPPGRFRTFALASQALG